MKYAFLIAAPKSGSGKTTVARSLMASLVKRGYTVQPFKCGPDYIDTKFHEWVCGRGSVNLDLFMAGEEHVRELFERYGADADVCVVEGMMGLFDGYDRDRGSSAEVARVLDIPVVLVVDAASSSYSLAALLTGFMTFRSDVRFAGVIYNKVGSPRHAAMLRQVSEDVGLVCLGCLPKSAEMDVGSRYLGLDFSRPCRETAGAPAGKESVFVGEPENGKKMSNGHRCDNLVAMNDESFSFVYRETIDALGDVGVWNPETDVPDLDGVSLLYLPGGYPEKHVVALSHNVAARAAVKAYAERGGRIVAECGGMMYLCKSIVTDDGEWPMCGVLPYTITARKADRRLSLGYRRFVLDGREYRGHEFHYTQFEGAVPPSVCQVFNAKGDPVPTPVFKYRNVLASYIHLAKTNNENEDPRKNAGEMHEAETNNGNNGRARERKDENEE